MVGSGVAQHIGFRIFQYLVYVPAGGCVEKVLRNRIESYFGGPHLGLQYRINGNIIEKRRYALGVENTKYEELNENAKDEL